MVELIMKIARPLTKGHHNDISWWMGTTNRQFSVKSAWKTTWHRKEKIRDYDFIGPKFCLSSSISSYGGYGWEESKEMTILKEWEFSWLKYWCCESTRDKIMTCFSNNSISHEAMEIVCSFCRYSHGGHSATTTNSSLME